MRELFNDWIEPFKEFRFTAHDQGFFVALFYLLMYLVFTLLCVPFLIIWFPFSFMNEKSKEFFK